jgi:hypothetical protein
MKQVFGYGWREVFWFSLGSIMIAFSSGIGLIAAFESKLLLVYVCLIFFLFGYRVFQAGLHSEHGILGSFRSDFLAHLDALDYLSLVGGSLVIAFSFTLLTDGMVLLDVSKSFSAAVLMGSGYILAHWAINNTLV